MVTPLGGPVFLVDGFGRTEVARNLFGSGLQYFENAEQGKDLFNVGVWFQVRGWNHLLRVMVFCGRQVIDA